MENQNNRDLYAKMEAEQEAYRAELLAMPPEKILNHTWEYTAREDIMDAVYNEVLPENQVRALLKSPSPLADVLKEYRDLDVSNDDILAAVENAANLHLEPPLYLNSADFASRHGELEAYAASWKANEACVYQIEKAIDCNYHDNHFEVRTAMETVLKKCRPERVQLVLANQVKSFSWDKRYSSQNRVWANTIDTTALDLCGPKVYMNVHPGLVDMFISAFRREVMEQGKAQKTAAPAQRKPPERSDDFEL